MPLSGFVSDWQSQLRPEELIIFYGALCFLFGGLLLIGFLFASRVIKSSKFRRTVHYRELFQKILNAVVVNEMFSQRETPAPGFAYRIDELKTLIAGSTLARQVLTDKLLEMKKNLSGSSAQTLVATYYDLGLEKSSMKKIRSLAWEKKAKGIRELAEIGHKDGVAAISRFIHSSNVTLREESVMALVRLQSDSPLFFLDQYKYALTPWMQLNIFHFIQKVDARSLPDFSRWYHHGDLSVRLFCIEMTKHFKQFGSLPALAKLINDGAPSVAAASVDTIGHLGAFQHRDEVIRLAETLPADPAVIRSMLRCLGKIGDEQTDITVVAPYLEHPQYAIRFEAALACRDMGKSGEAFLRAYSEQHDNRFDSMIRHLTEPLLQ